MTDTVVPPSLTTLDYAHGYGRLGWRIFPVWPHDKRPMYRGWPEGATADPEMIQQYFGADPTRNIGVVCGDAFDAWDIEADHIGMFTAWLVEHGRELPEGPLARTGRGGMHYLTQPTDINHTRALYLNGTHIGELKSAGGFIVVAPSVTEGPYLWQWTPYQMAPSPAPEWLLGLVRQPETPRRPAPWRNVSLAPQSDIRPLLEAVRGSQPGNRNALLHWAANRALDDGIDQSFAERELMAAFIEVSQNDEDRHEREHEARATIASAYSQ